MSATLKLSPGELTLRLVNRRDALAIALEASHLSPTVANKYRVDELKAEINRIESELRALYATTDRR